MLAVIVLHAVSGLIKVKELKKIYQLNKVEFLVAMIALAGVLTFGILKGVMLAVIMSLLLLIMRTAHPAVAILGRIGDTKHYSDIERHRDNITYKNILILRIESSILYFNAGDIQDKIMKALEACRADLKLIILDLSAAPYVDVAGSKMLVQLSLQIRKTGIRLKIVEALSNVRDILRKQGMEKIIGHISRHVFINDVVQEFIAGEGNGSVPEIASG
jgi:anti-anti-sigma factor